MGLLTSTRGRTPTASYSTKRSRLGLPAMTRSRRDLLLFLVVITATYIILRPNLLGKRYRSILTPSEKSTLLAGIEADRQDPIDTRVHLPQAPLNRAALDRLEACLLAGTCTAEQESVVILASDYCENALKGKMAGENVQCMSLIRTLEDLQYTVIVEGGIYNGRETLNYFKLLKPLVKIVLAHPWQFAYMLQHDMIQSTANANGIDIAKIGLLDWWGTRPPMKSEHPLGAPFYATAFEMTDHFYLGFSIDHLCDSSIIIDPAERSNDAILLTKRSLYFWPEKNAAWAHTSYPTITEKMRADGMEGFRFRTFIQADANDLKIGGPVPAGIENEPPLTADEYAATVARSKVMVGIGRPVISPSPYLALCMGVPFINPHLRDAPPPSDWHNSLRTDGSGPNTYQHGPLAMYDAPYVYNVPYKNETAFADALATAMRTPIEPWLAPEVSEMENRRRVRNLMRRDWEAIAREQEAILGKGRIELTDEIIQRVKDRAKPKEKKA